MEVQEYRRLEAERRQRGVSQLTDEPPKASYTPTADIRLQPFDPAVGHMWVGSHDKETSALVQAFGHSAEEFRKYVNKLLDAYGHLTYAQLERVVNGPPPGHDEADPSYD